MKTSLRKAFYVGLLIFFVVAVTSVVVGFVSADGGCNYWERNTVCFGQEDHKGWIGSYTMVDENGRYLYRNHWKNKIDLMINGEGCIYPRPGTQTTFLSKAKTGWFWKAKTDIFGYTCYRLKKY